MGGEEDIPHAEYEWAVMLKDGLHDGIKVPDIATESFDFERWEKNLLRTMVGKMPYMLKPDGSRLIENADTPFQRRGNRALYSAIWDKLTEKSATESKAELFQNQSSAPIGNGIELVYELRDYLSHGPEAANVAVGQLDSVSLTSTDPDAVDKFLDTLEALAAKAGSLVNDVTLINRIEANLQGKQFEAYLQVVTLQRLINKWDAKEIIRVLRGKAKSDRADNARKPPPPDPSNSRRQRQLSMLSTPVTKGCSIHGPDAKHTDAECRLQQRQSQPQSTTVERTIALDPALPRGTCNAFWLHGSCKRGEKCRWKHDQTKAAIHSSVPAPSTQAAARQPPPMPDLLDLDAPAVPLAPRTGTPSNSMMQLASLPPEQLTAVMQAFIAARDATSGPSRQLAAKRIKRVRQEAETDVDQEERAVVVTAPAVPVVPPDVPLAAESSVIAADVTASVVTSTTGQSDAIDSRFG